MSLRRALPDTDRLLIHFLTLRCIQRYMYLFDGNDFFPPPSSLPLSLSPSFSLSPSPSLSIFLKKRITFMRERKKGRVRNLLKEGNSQRERGRKKNLSLELSSNFVLCTRFLLRMTGPRKKWKKIRSGNDLS